MSEGRPDTIPRRLSVGLHPVPGGFLRSAIIVQRQESANSGHSQMVRRTAQKKATLSRGFDTSGISIEGIESLANFGSEFFEGEGLLIRLIPASRRP